MHFGRSRKTAQRIRGILLAMAAVCICGMAHAQSVDVNNFSFEFDGEGEQIEGHIIAGWGVGLMGWTNEGDWIGADVPIQARYGRHCILLYSEQGD